MLVISGVTYTSRLWCILELFVYVSVYISMRDEQLLPDVIFLGDSHEERAAIERSWASFDALQCHCVDPSDKERILAVIAGTDEGISGFNQNVAEIASALFNPASACLSLDF